MKADDLRRRASSFPWPCKTFTAAVAASLFGTSALVAAGYMFFHDDILRSLLDRQIEMQYAYEDQLATARLQLDQAATRRMLDQDGVKGQIEKLALRETMLETRAAAVAELVERVSRESTRDVASAEIKAPTIPPKPEPEEWDLRLGDAAPARRATLAESAPASAAARRLKRVFDMAGLSADRIVAQDRRLKAAPALGGPFIPADEPVAGTTAFERDLAAARSSINALDRLRGALSALPLRKPLNGELRLSSGFGYRVDPFLGKPALHSGVDLLEDYGEPVRATAGGTIVAAGPSGGYGNIVELEHGSGYSTRYGHLSQISVTPGQKIAPGTVLGRVGSTGRSTGAHLHYEVRADGEAIDPARFLRAAAALNEMGE